MRLGSAQHETLTDTLGWFAFTRVRPGTYTFQVEHIGYGTQADTVRVPEGETMEVVFRASAEAIALEPLEVRVLPEVERLRRAQGHPHHLFITRQEIEEYFDRGAMDVGDVLRMHKPNAVRVRHIGLSDAGRNTTPGPCIESARAVTGRGLSSKPACMMVAAVVSGALWADRCDRKECETLLPFLAGGAGLGLAGGEIAFRLRR